MSKYASEGVVRFEGRVVFDVVEFGCSLAAGGLGLRSWGAKFKIEAVGFQAFAQASGLAGGCVARQMQQISLGPRESIHGHEPRFMYRAYSKTIKTYFLMLHRNLIAPYIRKKADGTLSTSSPTSTKALITRRQQAPGAHAPVLKWEGGGVFHSGGVGQECFFF